MITSDAATTELFATWTTYFDVQVDLPLGKLTFTPARKDGLYLRPRSLFARPGKGERPYQKVIGNFLSLSPATPPEVWQRTATELGPLFVHHPMHHAISHNQVTEALADWLKARDALAMVWEDLQGLSTASATPLTPEERRQVGLENLLVAGLAVTPESLPPAELEPLLEAFMPPSHRTDLSVVLHRIGIGLNQWFQPLQPPIVPLLNPQTLQVELVVHRGVQALLLMTVALAREDMTAFPNRCARPGCTAVAFMKGRRIYCSKRCQDAHKSARYRQRAGRLKRTPPT